MKFIKSTFFLSLVFFLGSCVSYAPQLDTNINPARENGFVFGVMKLITDEYHSYYLEAGLTLENIETTKKYTIEFSKTTDVVAIELTPGTYKLDRVVYAVANELKGTTVLTDDRFTKPFEILAGKVHYLGNIYAEAGSSLFGPDWWSIRHWIDNFEEDSHIFLSNYKWFNETDLVNCSPKESAAGAVEL